MCEIKNAHFEERPLLPPTEIKKQMIYSSNLRFAAEYCEHDYVRIPIDRKLMNILITRAELFSQSVFIMHSMDECVGNPAHWNWRPASRDVN